MLNRKRFDLVVCDLSYGVQFRGEDKRNPLDVVSACAEGWLASRRSGAMVLIFNRYQPKRQALSDVFAAAGAHVLDFSVRIA